MCGWIADLAESLSIEVRVANTLGEAWKWENIPGSKFRPQRIDLADETDGDISERLKRARVASGL